MGFFAQHGPPSRTYSRYRKPGLTSRYIEYLASPRWRAKRAEALEDAEYTCEECGATEAEAGVLEVHHHTYERLGNEDPEDLSVLCPTCHKAADAARKDDAKDRALNTWATKVYGYDWEQHRNSDEIEEEFEEWWDARHG